MKGVEISSPPPKAMAGQYVINEAFSSFYFNHVMVVSHQAQKL